MKIAIIGAGNMGGAIARGLAKGSIIPASDIIVANPSEDKLEQLYCEFPNIRTTTVNQDAATGADMIIFAVKPWLMKSVVRDLKIKSKQVLISVASGVSFEEMAHYVAEPEMTMFRIIPNTAIKELASMTLIASRNATKEQEKLLMDIFNEMGLTMLIPEEKLPAATSMTSCGIAYALKYIQAVTQAGIELGIYPKDGMKMVAQSLKGAAELILNNDTHPAVEIEKVCTPGGDTIKGINELDHCGFTSALISTVKKSLPSK